MPALQDLALTLFNSLLADDHRKESSLASHLGSSVVVASNFVGDHRLPSTGFPGVYVASYIVRAPESKVWR